MGSQAEVQSELPAKQGKSVHGPRSLFLSPKGQQGIVTAGAGGNMWELPEHLPLLDSRMKRKIITFTN